MLSINQVVSFSKLPRFVITNIFVFVSIIFSGATFAESGRADYDLDDDGLIEINDLGDLYEIRNNLDGSSLYSDSTGCPGTGCNGFELTTNLDFDTNGDGVMDANDTYWNAGEGWLPIIGSSEEPFSAILEGNHYSILNLYINRGSSDDIGLFGALNGATIRNIHLQGDLMNITGNAAVGSLFGYVTGNPANLSDCQISGEVFGSTQVGGIGGYAQFDLVDRCIVNTQVTVSGNYAGGFFGRWASSGTISDSVFAGQIEGTSNVGGVIGWASNAISLERVISYGDVTGDDSTSNGGLLGNSSGSVAESETYWDLITSTQEDAREGAGNGFNTSDLRCPTLPSDDACTNSLYSSWSVTDWDFGSTDQYPALIINSQSYLDSDRDGSWDHNDTDDDNDGVADGSDAFPYDSTESVDTDGDGVGDNSDAFPEDPTETVDTDGDGTGDNTDEFPNDPSETIDSDGDGVGDNADAFPLDASETTDSDGDGVGDNADEFPNDASETTDSDSDGVGDNADAFPNDEYETTDTDGDGIGNNADGDDDNDGVTDTADAFPLDSTETNDSDADGTGDNADIDVDGDGLIEIKSLADLNEVRNHLDGAGLYGSSAGCPGSGCVGFELTTDLDFDTNGDGVMDANDTYWNDGEGWEPIGSDTSYFSATFNGNGFSILNLYIDRSSDSSVALFAALRAATLEDFDIRGDLTQVVGSSMVGLVAGIVATESETDRFTGDVTYGDTSTIRNCYISGKVSGSNFVGTVSGGAVTLTLESCYARGEVAATSNEAGGLIGDASGPLEIVNTSFEGTVTGSSNVGGLAGASRDIEISFSYAFADVSASFYGAGGLIGNAIQQSDTSSSISNSLALGSVSSAHTAGGLVGEFEADGGFPLIISDSVAGNSVAANDQGYAAGIVGVASGDIELQRVLAYGVVEDTSPVGGLVSDRGSNYTITVTEAYWDTESSGQSSTFNNDGSGLITSELQCPQNPGDDRCTQFLYSTWSTDNWDFGSASQYPALIINGFVYRDSDNDGAWDIEDAFPNDDTESADRDGDGVGDNADDFPNDATETTDSDGDGLGDNLETSLGMDPNDANDFYVDSDGDGIYDGQEALSGTDLNDANDFVSPLDNDANGNGYFELLISPSSDYTENYAGTISQGADGFVYSAVEFDGNESSIAISRFDTSLNLETSFGQGGHIYGFDFGLSSYFADVIVNDSSNNLLINLRNCNSNDCILALDSDGVLSSSRFQTQTSPGIFSFSSRTNASRFSIEASDGTIIDAGNPSGANGYIQIQRINADDELDSSFASNATYLNLNFYDSSGIELTRGLFEVSDGEFVVAADANSDLHLAKFDINGDLITSFGVDGIVSNAIGANRRPRKVIQDQAGGFLILTEDSSGDDQGLYIYRLDSVGNIDLDFGSNGYFAYLEPTNEIRLSVIDLFQQPDGHILLVSSVRNTNTLLSGASVIKLTAEGELDQSFGVNGEVLYSLKSDSSISFAELLDNHNIVITGGFDDGSSVIYLIINNTNDADGDGISDDDDAFPNDESESVDTDGDGVGDNSDAFPNDASETTDSDGDGVGDNSDVFPNDASESADSDGDGTGDNADVDLDNDGLIEIDSIDDLNEINDHLDGSALYGSNAGCPVSGCNGFELATNLDFDTNNDGVIDANDDYWITNDYVEGFDPIGDGGNPFTGIFDGNNFAIRNLYVNASNDSAGLFASVNGAVIQNLIIEGELTSITAATRAGLLFGHTDEAGVTVSDSQFSGAVEAVQHVGGLGGLAESIIVESVKVNATLSNTSRATGGFVGEVFDYSTVRYSSFEGEINGVDYVAGIFGYSDSVLIYGTYVIADINASSNRAAGFVGELNANAEGAIINFSFVSGSVSGTNFVGGLVGLGASSSDLIIADSLVAASVQGEDLVGGIFGAIYNDTNITNSIAYGAIQASAELPSGVGGLVGSALPGVTIVANEAYWDIETTGLNSTENDSGIGLTTEALQCPIEEGDLNCSETIYSTWSDGLWDFGTTEQYPALIISDVLYRDTDGDGVWDSEDAFPNDASETTDTDGDGVGDNSDAFPNDATETTDTDDDGIGNNADTDDDNDGVEDASDAFPLDATESVDTDSDGIGNNVDTDDDNDGVEDASDAFPLDETEWLDSDGDGVGDNSDESPYPYSGDINFELSEYSVAENGLSIELKVVRSNGDYEELSVDYSLQDGSATATNDYEFAAGTLVFANGEVEKTISVVIVDDDTYEGDETFTASLSNLVSIGEATIGSIATATITINEDEAVPPGGEIGFEFDIEAVNENDGSLTLNIIRTNGSYGEVSVSVYSQDDSAVAGSDYQALSETITFADGEAEKTVTINMVNDDIYETDEVFTLQLSNIIGDATLGTSTVTFTVYDDEPLPPGGVLEIEFESYQVNENSNSLEVNIVRTSGSSGEVSVDLVSANQTATAGEDYEAVGQTVTFNDGEVSKTVTINLVDDEVYEGSEVFTLELTNVTGTELGTISDAQVEIAENDPVPPSGVIQFSGASYEVDEDAGTLSITITRTNGTDGDQSFDLHTFDESAVNGPDYFEIAENMVMLDGQNSLVVALQLNDDEIYEGDESLRIVISNLEGGATLGSISEAMITIKENESVPSSGNVRFSGTGVSVNEASSELSITVLRIDGNYGDISVDYEVKSDTAINGEDFNATNGILYFNEGEESQTITISIIDDQLDENDEFFTVELLNPFNTTIVGASSATINISDNDSPVSEAGSSSGGGALSWWLLMLLIPLRLILGKRRFNPTLPS